MICFVFFSPANEYGLFLADEDPTKGVWLESGKTLEHYLLRHGVSTQGTNPSHIKIVLLVSGDPCQHKQVYTYDIGFFSETVSPPPDSSRGAWWKEKV